MNLGNWAKKLPPILWVTPFQGLWQQLSTAAAPEAGSQLSLALPNPQAGGSRSSSDGIALM